VIDVTLLALAFMVVGGRVFYFGRKKNSESQKELPGEERTGNISGVVLAR